MTQHLPDPADSGLLEPGDDHPVQTALLREIGPHTFLRGFLHDDVRERERLLQLRLVLADLKGVHTGMIATVIFAIAAHGQVRPGGWLSAAVVPWLWCALMLAGFGYAMAIERRYKRAQTAAEVHREGRRLIGFAVYCGLMWGATSWVLLPGRTPAYEALVIIGVAMVMMGGAGAQAMYRPLLRSFVVPLAVVFAAGIVVRGDRFHFLLGGGVLLLAVTLLAATKLQEDAVKAAIRLGFESQRLLAERTEQQALTAKALVEAERANAGKSTFLATAGHDLRQPMDALSLYLGHLQRVNRDATLNEALHGAGQALAAMQDLLDSVLEASKLMMGAVQPVLRPFPVSRVIERVDAQLRPMAMEKRLALAWVGPSHAVVHTDEVLLERVLRNLALNAIRYTRAGGVLVRLRPRGGVLCLQVWDSGIGMARHEVERVFDAFYQVDHPMRSHHEGLGLGLALVRQVCELLGYRLRVRSAPGRGSVFMVDLPLTAAGAPVTTP
ncbi:MAG: HAMP domain-containing histidine kinase [Rhizobacter sp.]|nr:HAMP domain-containing histidine kinase [Rhizobacter sp.]